MQSKLLCLSYVLLPLLLRAFPLRAQTASSYGVLEGKVLTTHTFLLNPSDPVSASLGNAKTILASGVANVYYNPSAILFDEEAQSGVNINYRKIIDNAQISDVYALSLGGFYRPHFSESWSGSVRMLHFGQLGLISENFESFGQMNPFELATDLGYAKRISKAFSLSSALRYIYGNYTSGASVNNGNIDIVATHSLAMDINVTYVKPFLHKKELMIAGGFHNLGVTLGSRYTYNFQSYIPAFMSLGMHYKMNATPTTKLLLFAECTKLLVPVLYIDPQTKKINDAYTDPAVVRGYFISLSDNKDGLMGELSEIATSLGVEVQYDNKVSFRLGYFKDAKTLTDMQMLGMGLSVVVWRGIGVHLSYNTILSQDPIYLNSINNNALRIGLTFEYLTDLVNPFRSNFNYLKPQF